MNKKEVKEILFSIRTSENEAIVNNILGKIDMMTDEDVKDKTKNVSETLIKEYFEKQIKNKSNRGNSYFIKINNFFEYSISGDCVSLHLPGDFHDMVKKEKVRTIAKILAKLIDAANKINNQRNMGDSKLRNCSSMYMISPIFYSPSFYPEKLRNSYVRSIIKIEAPVLKFFRLMGMETATYTRQELQNSSFVEDNKEAQIAVKNFGTGKDIGSAKISFDKFDSKKVQARLKKANAILERISEPTKEER